MAGKTLRRCLSLLLLLILAACSRQEPVRIGFIGGLTGRIADLGEVGRNGAQLAIEQRNLAGGIGGRPIELVIRDDGQDAARARNAFSDLLAIRVEAVVGPMTSAMAEILVPLTRDAGLVLVSPTVTANQFYGIDDSFFLIMPSADSLARYSADFQLSKYRSRRVAALLDQRNRAYVNSWLGPYRDALGKQGGELIEIPYDSSAEPPYGELVDKALRLRPDGLLLLTSAVDTARLAQHVRARDARLPLITSMWAGTQKLVELGGRAVEGMAVYLTFDPESSSPSYQAFRKAYVQRFQVEPDFASVAAYDATMAIIEGLARRHGTQTLKESLLHNGPFPGAQDQFVFNATGDSQRKPHALIVQGGRFVADR